METHSDRFCAASTLAAEASRQILQCADAGKGCSLWCITGKLSFRLFSKKESSSFWAFLFGLLKNCAFHSWRQVFFHYCSTVFLHLVAVLSCLMTRLILVSGTEKRSLRHKGCAIFLQKRGFHNSLQLKLNILGSVTLTSRCASGKSESWMLKDSCHNEAQV